MEIFKKWWFYVIAAAVIVLLPFSIKYALQPPESAAEAVAAAGAGDTASVDTTETPEAPGLGVSAETGDAEGDAEPASESADVLENGTADEAGDIDAGGAEDTPENTGGEPLDDETEAAEEPTVPPEDGGDAPEVGGDSDPDDEGGDADSGGGETGAEVTYILNKNSRRFHLPSCSSVGDMKEKNREDSTLTRKELIDAGWVPCGRCKP